MWPKFGNSSISLREALGMTLKFYTSAAKELKLKVRKFCGLSPTFVEVTWEKLVWGRFLHPFPHALPHFILKWVKRREGE